MAQRAELIELISDRKGNGLPRIVNGYSLVSELGRGGTAIAYRAEKDGSVFCVREHRFGRMPEGDAFKAHELFEREADVLRKLDHPMIPKVYDLFDFGEGSNFSIYMVQQLMPGECLQSILNREGVFGEEQIVDFMLPITDVISYLHSQVPPVVHKDVKPSNIMYDKDAGISLIDFGILQQAFLRTVGGSTTFGTVGFSAPEVFFGQATTRSDLYSVGSTILALASGLEPHELLEGMQLEYKGKFRFQNPSLEVLVDKLIQFNPEVRPKTVQEVADYLQQIKEGKQLSVPRENAGWIKQFFMGLLPESWVRSLVRDRADIVADEQRTNGLLVASQEKPTDRGFPSIIIPNDGSVIEKTDKYPNEHSKEHWIYYNIPVPGKDGTLEEKTLIVTKDFLFGGAILTQDEHIKRLKGTGISLITAPECLAICAYLTENENHPDKDQRTLIAENTEWFKKIFRDYWLITGTGQVYRPNGSGQIIQNIGRDDQYVLDVDELVGPDGKIIDLPRSGSALKGTFGVNDIAYINSTFKKVIGKDSYYWRINQNPSEEQERAVVFGLSDYGDRFNINANSNFIGNGGPARGVVTQRARNFHMK